LEKNETGWARLSASLSEQRCSTTRCISDSGRRWFAYAHGFTVVVVLPPAVPAAKPLVPTASCGYKRTTTPWSSSFFLLPHRITSTSCSDSTSAPRAVPTPTTAPVTRALPVSTFSSSLSQCPVQEARQLLRCACQLPAARLVSH
jgi:hypothetical protein